MPIYEYECNSCGHRLEMIQRVSDPPLADCPECKAATLRKLVSLAGFRLKGTGWYETDFKTKSDQKPGKSESKPDESKKSGASETGGNGSSAPDKAQSA